MGLPGLVNWSGSRNLLLVSRLDAYLESKLVFLSLRVPCWRPLLPIALVRRSCYRDAPIIQGLHLRRKENCCCGRESTA
jgi:hypothetical protein